MRIYIYLVKKENYPADRRKEIYPLRDSQLVEVAEAPQEEEKHWMDPPHVLLSCLSALSYFQTSSCLFWKLLEALVNPPDLINMH